MAYILNTSSDVREMLGSLGLNSLEQLFEAIPAELRLKRPLSIPAAMPEMALTSHVSALAARNQGVDRLPCFLGGGAYDHFIPAAVDQLASRSEFYSAYTPYQAEASQGTLQAIFEYQTLITQLTGLDVSNASLYDGGSAAAEAMMMAHSMAEGRDRILVAGSVHPEYRATLETYAANLPLKIDVIEPVHGQVTAKQLTESLNDQTAAVLVQQPNFFGQLEDLKGLTAAAKAHGATAIVSIDPISLGLLQRPGDLGADIVIAEGQSLGNILTYGGPYLGILACRESYLRKLPGRVVGQTTDRRGNRCWVLTLQTREQHIRREKATSNICTNQGLMALRASIYLALLGPQGLREAAELSTRKAHYAAQQLAQIPGISLAFPGPFFKEFVIRVKGDPHKVLEHVLARGFHGGIPLGQWYPALADSILIAVTEKRSRAEIDGLAAAYQSALHAK